MKNLLLAAADQFIHLNDNQLLQFEKLTEIMVQTNKTMNITAITDNDGIMLKHYADSLSLLSTGLFDASKKVCDIGCGGGFPGLPLKIAMPELYINMIDSTEKKINYLRNTSRILGLEKIDFTSARAEELTKFKNKNSLREKYDIATARAVASLETLCELCLPFVKCGGYFLAMKGAKTLEEVEKAKNAITALGARLREIKRVEFDLEEFLPNPVVADFCNSERNIIIIEKVKPTPVQYPRAYAAIVKKPL